MNRFRVSFTVTATKLGEILAALHGEIDDLDVALVETVAHNKNRKRGSTRETLLTLLNDQHNKSMGLKDVRAIFTREGLNPDLVYAAKDALVKKGLIEFKNGIMRLK